MLGVLCLVLGIGFLKRRINISAFFLLMRQVTKNMNTWANKAIIYLVKVKAAGVFFVCVGVAQEC